jgi:hypothetical protein
VLPLPRALRNRRKLLRNRAQSGVRRCLPYRPVNIFDWTEEHMSLFECNLILEEGPKQSPPVLFPAKKNDLPPMLPGGRAEVLARAPPPSRDVDLNESDATLVVGDRCVTATEIQHDYAQITFAGGAAMRAAEVGLNLGPGNHAAVVPGGVRMPADDKKRAAGVHYFLAPDEERSVSALHRDRGGSVLFVPKGRKYIVLGPPCAVPRSHKLPGTDTVKDGRDPFKDMDPFKDLFPDVPPPWRMIRVEEGDAVYIPQGWYHKVWSEKGTFAVSIELQQLS